MKKLFCIITWGGPLHITRFIRLNIFVFCQDYCSVEVEIISYLRPEELSIQFIVFDCYNSIFCQ